MVTAVRSFIGGLPSWLVSSSSSDPKLTANGVAGEQASMSIPRGRGRGCCKSMVWSVSLSGESSHRSCVWFKFVLPNSLNVSGRFAKERILCTDVLCCEAMSGHGGGGGRRDVMWP